MEFNRMWVPCTGAGLEHLSLQQQGQGIGANGVVIGTNEGVPFRLWYEIQTEQNWHVRKCVLRLLDSEMREVILQSDGQGHWADELGTPLPELDGCLDVDLSATPFTNTLPIRRLSLQPGQAADLSVVYIAVPTLKISVLAQRYTCLESRPDGGLYRYESLVSGFTRDLPVDAEGLVIDYPGIWKSL